LEGEYLPDKEDIPYILFSTTEILYHIWDSEPEVMDVPFNYKHGHFRWGVWKEGNVCITKDDRHVPARSNIGWLLFISSTPGGGGLCGGGRIPPFSTFSGSNMIPSQMPSNLEVFSICQSIYLSESRFILGVTSSGVEAGLCSKPVANLG
jgi:hypothetical protein